MTRDARIDEIGRELNRMEDTLSGCDWCEGCGGGDIIYQELLDELRDLEGHYVRVTAFAGEVSYSTKYDFRPKKTGETT